MIRHWYGCLFEEWWYGPLWLFILAFSLAWYHWVYYKPLQWLCGILAPLFS